MPNNVFFDESIYPVIFLFSKSLIVFSIMGRRSIKTNGHLNFTGVTGGVADLATFATQVNAAFQKMPGQAGEPYTMDHTGNIVIVNPRGHYHGFIKMPHTRAKLVETFRSLRASF